MEKNTKQPIISYRDAVQALKTGQIILFQTEIDWVLGCDAGNENAIKNILALADDDEVPTILISDIIHHNQYVQNVPNIAWDIIEFAEFPLSVLFSKYKGMPNLLIENQDLSIRFVKDDFPKNLVYQFGRGILTVPVATKTIELTDEIKQKADYQVPSPSGFKAIPYARLSVMKITEDGSIKFIKKGN